MRFLIVFTSHRALEESKSKICIVAYLGTSELTPDFETRDQGVVPIFQGSNVTYSVEALLLYNISPKIKPSNSLVTELANNSRMFLPSRGRARRLQLVLEARRTTIHSFPVKQILRSILERNGADPIGRPS
mgnify:CR=1 FL=1